MSSEAISRAGGSTCRNRTPPCRPRLAVSEAADSRGAPEGGNPAGQTAQSTSGPRRGGNAVAAASICQRRELDIPKRCRAGGRRASGAGRRARPRGRRARSRSGRPASRLPRPAQAVSVRPGRAQHGVRVGALPGGGVVSRELQRLSASGCARRAWTGLSRGHDDRPDAASTTCRHCVESVVADGVAGDVIEAGAWRGRRRRSSCGPLSTPYGDDREVWVADSFPGFPDDRDEDRPEGALSTFEFLVGVRGGGALELRALRSAPRPELRARPLRGHPAAPGRAQLGDRAPRRRHLRGHPGRAGRPSIPASPTAAT